MKRRHIRKRPAPVAEAPKHPELSPVDPERGSLYSVAELYDTADYAESLDARAYAWSREPATRHAARARALHDFAIDEALDAWIEDRHIVGVMGGHAVARGTAAYADAVLLGRVLGTDHVVATGGGPGAMEAANLGAWLAPLEDADAAVAEALHQLAGTASYTPVGPWARSALEVRNAHDAGGRRPSSLGIPTWYYGHEPPNVFCDAIAKYFRNAVREAILLQVCDRGIVFLPGTGGTVQEIFQDACENYYAEPSLIAPMILVGRDYWTETFPAWPLLQSLARGRAMADHIHLVDSLDEVPPLVG